MSEEYSLSGKLTPENLAKKKPAKALVKKKRKSAAQQPDDDDVLDVPGTNHAAGKIWATVESVNGTEYIVIRTPVIKNQKISRTGKSVIVGNTRGRRRVYKIVDGKKEPFTIDGAQVCAIATAYVLVREMTTKPATTEETATHG